MSLRISPLAHPAPATPSVPWTPWPVDRSNISVCLPQRVNGARGFAMVSKGHNTVFVVDPNDFTAKVCESGIEGNTFLVASADPDVASIICQAPPVEFVDRDGEIHDTYYDFLLKLFDGSSHAVMVKKADKVRRAGLDQLAEELAAQLPDGFADSVQLLTDEDLPWWLVSNARLIHAARLDPVCELDDQIAARAAMLPGPVTVAELVAPWAPRGPRSVARLIFQKRLKQVHVGLIDPTTLVVAVHKAA